MQGGCTACGVSGHSHVTCVLLGAALHRWMLQLGPGKDMTLVVDIILRLLMWGWREARCGEPIITLSYTPGVDIISAGGRGGSVFFMSAQTGERGKLRLPYWWRNVNSMAFSSDGAIIAAARPGATSTSCVAAANVSEIRVFGPYNAQTPWQEKTLSGHSHIVSCLAFKPGDPDILVSGSWDKTLKIWDLSTPACLSTVNVDSTVKSVAFSPCGKTIAVGCWRKVVIVDVATAAVMRSLHAHAADVNAVAWSACGELLASGGADKLVYIYDAQTFEDAQTFGCPLRVDSTVESVAFSPEGDMIAAGCHNGTIHLVETLTFLLMRSLRGHWENNPECICFEEEEEVRPDCPVTGHSRGVSSVAFSADGRWVMSGSSDKTIRLWDTHAVAQ